MTDLVGGLISNNGVVQVTDFLGCDTLSLGCGYRRFEETQCLHLEWSNSPRNVARIWKPSG